MVEQQQVSRLFDEFVEASTMRHALSAFHRILNQAQLKPGPFNPFFARLKQAVLGSEPSAHRKSWKAKALFSKLDKRAAHRCYSNQRGPPSRTSNHQQQHLEPAENQPINNNALEHYRCLVIGSGPAGLRTAIELQLLGASQVLVAEKRSRFSRNNVLHLWPFVIDDLKSLGAKKFYGKFCAGSIDHISIRQLQLMLLKISLMLGCDFRDSCSYLHLCPTSLASAASAPSESQLTTTTSQQQLLHSSDTEKAHSFCDMASSASAGLALGHHRCDLAQAASSSHLQEPASNQSTGRPSTEKLSSSLNNLEQLKPARAHSGTHMKSLDNYNREGLTSPTPAATAAAATNKSTSQQIADRLRGCRAHFQSDHLPVAQELHQVEWDIIVGADGRRNTMGQFFPRKEFRGRLAIAITANFINRQTPAEASVSEISGLSFIYNQDMFNSLTYDTNIQLENICYYKDDTHYFVMTAKKKSLLERGVLISDYATTQDLLSDSNVNRQALLKYARDAAHWTTGLEPLDFALNHYGQEDCAMFDFTSMHASTNACKAIRTSSGGLALVGLVGDSLLEPFWPTGSGCARGFLSSFDAAWMCRQWAINRCAVIDMHPSSSSRNSTTRNRSPGSLVGSGKRSQLGTNNRMALSVLAERESIYRILAQTTSENLQQNYSHWTLNPHTRYPNLNRHQVVPSQVEHLLSDGSGRVLEAPVKNKSTASKTLNGSTRRIKSPHNAPDSSRKSPKKLKSLTASPSKTLAHSPKYKATKTAYKSNQASVQRPFKMLYEDTSHYNSNWELDYFDVSVSGTLPSSNNLQSLEARRARDIDECLRQRRQKSQLHAVKDQLIGKFRSGEGATLAGAAITQELRRLREQRSSMAASSGAALASAGKENQRAGTGVNNSLSLLNSIRRCASFADRVRSFEEKLSQQSAGPESTPVTPRLPNNLDKVQNLPNFAHLQELFLSSSNTAANGNGHNQEPVKKSKIPIMKLSKEDWNVKCWEERLAKGAVGERGKQLGGSMMSLNRPAKKVELFRGRIKEMAEKLRLRDEEAETGGGDRGIDKTAAAAERPVGGWVSHLKKELIRGVEARRYPELDSRRPTATATPLRKPVKKLFESEDGDEDEDESARHYDHLCVNRPTNKYLSKEAYTSHLVRTKYNSATSRVVNTKPPASASKAAYLNSVPLVSRNSSASSTLSDYSSGHTSGATKSSPERAAACFRCKQRLRATEERILVAGASFHRTCLTCSKCALTLRSSEIRHYVNREPQTQEKEDKRDVVVGGDFLCSICEPSILAPEAAGSNHNAPAQDGSRAAGPASRAEFLSKTINYKELYRNILEAGVGAGDKIGGAAPSGNNNGNGNNKGSDLKFDESGRLDYTMAAQVPTRAPTTVTGARLADSGFKPVDKLAEPGAAPGESGARGPMIDEEELEQLMKGAAAPEPEVEDSDDEDDDESGGEPRQADASDVSEELSSLAADYSTSGSEQDDDADDNGVEDDQDRDEEGEQVAREESTCEDFLTSDEFGAASDEHEEEEAAAALERAPERRPEKLHQVGAS